MQVVHESGRVLADEVETADTVLTRARGLMFRRSIPEGYALVFPFDGVGRRSLHMLCVPFPIDACWLCGGVVERTATLRPWIGGGWARADTVIEFPAGALEGVDAGDEVRVEDE